MAYYNPNYLTKMGYVVHSFFFSVKKIYTKGIR